MLEFKPKCNLDEVEVTIECITYNHEPFIRKALDGFLMQKTDFKYIILVHDDASTDHTQEILMEYYNKYPDKIYLLLQEENQYSQKIDFENEYIFPRVLGRYIAACEGDDEWIYEYKLQKQYDLMENNPEISLCIHNAIRINEDKTEIIPQIMNRRSGCLSDREVFLCLDGRPPTASFFARSKYLQKFPEFNRQCPVGDEPFRFTYLLFGKCYYIDELWSIRNYMHKESWNYRMSNDENERGEMRMGMLEYIDKYNKYTNGKYEPILKEFVIWFIDVLLEIRAIDIIEKNLKQYELKAMLEKYEPYSITKDTIDDWFELNRVNCIDYIREDIKCFIRKAEAEGKRIYIYGAGGMGGIAYKKLKYCGIDIEGFIVSDGHREDCKSSMGNVYELCEIKDKSSYIWVCLNDKNKMEVLPDLALKKYWNVIN